MLTRPIRTLGQAVLLAALLRLAAAPLGAGEATKEPPMSIQLPRAVRGADERIVIETDAVKAEVWPNGYVSGVKANTFVDKRTGARDHSFGLDIVDFLLGPGAKKGAPYHHGDLFHGNIAKHYIELPQICTQAKHIPSEVVVGPDFVAVRQWWRWKQAAPGYKPGSLWEQTLVFPMGRRYFLASDRVESVNDVKDVFLRIDLPGHLKHTRGDTFEEIFLSYEGRLPAKDFFDDFPPDGRHLYQRGTHKMPQRMIRARRNRGDAMPWLAGMTLDPAIVSEGWCHQRGYVCFIQEIGRLDMKPGDSFAAAYIIGYFDSIEAMQKECDAHRGYNSLAATKDCWLMSDGVLVREGSPEKGLESPPHFRIVPQGRQPAPKAWRLLLHGKGHVVVNGHRLAIDGHRTLTLPAGK